METTHEQPGTSQKETAPTHPSPISHADNHSPNKFLVLGGIVILLLLAVLGGYYAGKQSVKPVDVAKQPVSITPTSTPSPTHTTDWNNTQWKIYTATPAGYTFQYPNNFQLHSNETHVYGTDNHYKASPNTIELVSPSEGVAVDIFHKEVSPTAELSELIAKNATCDLQGIKPRKVIVANGKVFQVYDATACGLDGETIAYLKNTNLFYEVHIYGEKLDSDKAFVDKFLASFTFQS